MKFDGRILILGTAPAAIKRQLSGEDLTRAAAGELRVDISTDEVTPLPILLNYDRRLGRYAHTGLTINGAKRMGENAIAGGGFYMLVGDENCSKESSREHSLLAEYSAGTRLVIAEGFEWIYRQNCDNIRLFIPTDFGLIDRIRAGEEISIEDLIVGRNPLAQAIVRAGGPLAYGATYLLNAPAAQCRSCQAVHLCQKIVNRLTLTADGLDWSARPGTGGFVRADFRFIHEYYTAMSAHMLHEYYGRPLASHEPDNILLFEDHLSYAHRFPTHLRLNLLAQPFIREVGGVGRIFEFAGRVNDAMSIDERRTITNMVADTAANRAIWRPSRPSIVTFAVVAGRPNMAGQPADGYRQRNRRKDLFVRVICHLCDFGQAIIGHAVIEDDDIGLHHVIIDRYMIYRRSEL